MNVSSQSMPYSYALFIRITFNNQVQIATPATTSKTSSNPKSGLFEVFSSYSEQNNFLSTLISLVILMHLLLPFVLQCH